MKSYPGNRTLRKVLGALGADRRGQIALMFALSALTIVTGVGAGVDLMRAYLVQQKLTHVATLTCQYASVNSVQQTSLPSYLGVGSLLTFTTNVNNFLTSTWGTQGVTYPQLTSTPLTTSPTGKTSVAVSTTVPTMFMKIINVSTIPVSAASDCYSTQAGGGPTQSPTGTPIVQEGFESTPCGKNAVCYISPTGQLSGNEKVPASPSSYSPSNAGYLGSTGTKWYITGYCLETDGVGLISATVPEGQTAAELDCDNGYGTGGNSAISTQVFMEAGNYELRYWYRARVDYPDYDPAYICGSSASDTSWANNQNNNFPTPAGDTRTNQINVYLDPPTANGAPPFHTTLQAPVQLAGSNLIDTCVYSPTWVERSVRVHVNTQGYYWLTFAADGADDSFGGQIDYIRLCLGTCAGTPQDNFPTAWLPVNNGGSNKILFQDTFSLPLYVDNTGVNANTNGNLNLSLGTSGTLASGWPSLAASGWATAPQNEVIYNTLGASQGLQNIWLSSPGTPRNRLMGRPFLLVPGFYNLAYDYVSEATFPSLGSTTYCGATPALANMSALSGNGTGVGRNTTIAMSGALNTSTLAVFIGSAQLVSTPNGGGALNSTTSYTNPDPNTANTPPVTTTSTTPTVAPDSISLTNYTPSTTSALLDICGYSAGWTSRSVNFEITKSGYYWIDFSTQMAGTSTYGGGAIDNVRLSALGSPAMLSPPSNPIVVPTAGPAPSSSLSFSSNAFTIAADPLTFPAPAQ